MATITTGSSNISSLDAKVVADLCLGIIFIDLSPTTFIGSGSLSVLGANVEVKNPVGVTIKYPLTSGYDFDNSDSPPLTEVIEVSIPTMSGNYMYGNYTVIVTMYDEDSTEYSVTKNVYVDYPNPLNKKKKVGTVGATIKGLCTDGVAVVQVDNVPVYRKTLVESQVNDFTLRFPTASLDDLETTNTAFSVTLFQGIYKLSGDICATYNLGDNVYAKVKYTLCYDKKIACIIDECCVLDKFDTLYKKLISDCSEEEKRTTSAVMSEATFLLRTAQLAIECNKDASDYISDLEGLLGCSCTSGCADGVPIGNNLVSTEIDAVAPLYIDIINGVPTIRLDIEEVCEALQDIGCVGDVVCVEPSITTEPEQSPVFNSDENISLTVVAEGTNLTYQWQFYNDAWIDITGQTTDTLTIAPESDDYIEGLYRVVVTNDCGERVSITSEVGITPVGSDVYFYYRVQDTPTLPSEAEILAWASGGSITAGGKSLMTTGANIVQNFTANTEPRYHLIAELLTEPEKQTWLWDAEGGLSQGDIGEGELFGVAAELTTLRVYISDSPSENQDYPLTLKV